MAVHRLLCSNVNSAAHFQIWKYQRSTCGKYKLADACDFLVLRQSLANRFRPRDSRARPIATAFVTTFSSVAAGRLPSQHSRRLLKPSLVIGFMLVIKCSISGHGLERYIPDYHGENTPFEFRGVFASRAASM